MSRDNELRELEGEVAFLDGQIYESKELAKIIDSRFDIPDRELVWWDRRQAMQEARYSKKVDRLNQLKIANDISPEARRKLKQYADKVKESK